ncbi:hypothetical protein B0H67DRAFT_684977 [Lasiosphaeris hirsuta]|uniref:Long-chain-alcohol oxidase n=1 Tax=Lasiosphaeris hirsuta TaxID=260670 RepID=A0AA40A8M9_9PEZI|nr:hypothetical protein B0H67DRAFT_684977 [Lasiosphaeris hirsuta]
MSHSTAAKTGPTLPGLPAPPPGVFLDETQWTVLMALLDAVIPSITANSRVADDMAQRGIADGEFEESAARAQPNAAEPPSTDLIKAYLEDRATARPGFKDAVRRTLGSVPGESLKPLGTALYALSTRPGSLLLTGSITPIHDRPLAAREAVLQAWSASWFGTPRLLFKTFTTLAKAIWLNTDPLLGQLLGFPAVPPGWKPTPPVFGYDFMQFPSADEPAEIETDVIVIGSGCGGGVSAKVLADAGHRVLVVDKGYHFPPAQLPMSQDQGSYHLFENNGVINSVDGSITTVSGSCWGGGGTVNWSVSLQTQGFVRREWAQECGLPFFETGEFQASLDRVCEFMGVVSGEKVKQTHRGRILLEGARKLGWPAEVCPQNSGGKEHWCGHCHLGCGSAEKQGPAVSWLPAAAQKGAKFIEGFTVDRVLWDDSSSGEKRAIGVRGTWASRDASGGVASPIADRTTREVIIRAKKVVVSSGTLNSPLVLMRSGLTNPHIGRNLHLHPVNFVGGFYEEDMKPWEGGIITSVCTNFDNLDGNGHGAKLEATCMLPFAFLTQYPWRSGFDYKLSVLRFRHLAGFISLARDRDTGRVFPDPTTGKPQVDYTISPFDAAHVLEGVLGIAKMLYVTGATEIHAFLPGIEPFIRPPPSAEEKLDAGITDPAFTAWLATVRAVGNSPPYAPYTSAHQMGSCRMSSHAGGGVVDSWGKVWGTEGLFVADASVFPSASGVNPMVTTMAVADWIARGVAKELTEEKQ